VYKRQADGKEVDILADRPDALVGFEVKSSVTVAEEDIRHLRWFAETGPGRTRRFCGIVLYLGAHKLSFGQNTFALPISALWSPIDL